MADQPAPEPHKQTTEFFKTMIKEFAQRNNKWDEFQVNDKLYKDRTRKNQMAHLKVAKSADKILQSHSKFLEQSSENAKENYQSGLKLITGFKQFGVTLANGFRMQMDSAMSREEDESQRAQLAHRLQEGINKRLDSVKDTLHKQKEMLIENVKTMPLRMVGATVNGFKAIGKEMTSRLGDKHDKLLAYFGNKDAKDRMEKKMEARKAGAGGGLGDSKFKEDAKKAGGWLKKMLGVLFSLGTSTFKGIFTKLFPAVGKFLLKNIGKLGLIGLATGLMATFWDDISAFVKKLFSGDSSEGNVVTKEGVKGMLDKLWGFVNDMVKDLFGVDLGKVLADKGIDIGSITTTISEYVTPVVNGFIKVGKALGQGFKNIIKDAFGEGEEKGKMGKFFDNIKKIASSVIDAVSNFTGGLFKTKDGKQKDIGQIVGDLMEHVRKFANMIMDAGNRLTEYILDPKELLGDIKLAFSGLGRIVGNAFTDFIIYAEALVKTGFGKLGNVNDKLAELKAEDAEKKALEAQKEEARFKSMFKDAKDITHMTDVGQYIKDMGLKGENKAYWENVLRDVVDSKQRVFEQTNEAIEAAAQGEVEKQLSQYKEQNLKKVLTGDANFGSSIKSLATSMEFGLDRNFDSGQEDKVAKFIMDMRNQNPEMAQQFMAKLETLDKAGGLNDDTARQLAKDLGLDSRFTQNDNDAKEFFDLLINAENIKNKQGTELGKMFNNIGEDQANKLLTAGFEQNTAAISSAVQQIAGMNANLSALPAILSQLPGAVMKGAEAGNKGNSGNTTSGSNHKSGKE